LTHFSQWLEEQDIFLLNPYFLLGVRKIHNRVALYLYNISDMGKVFIEREYELPAIWTNSIMRFGCNISPNADISIPPTAIFCSDPSARIVLLSARSEGPDEALSHWMFISESFFRPTSLEDRRTIPWGYWSQFCLIKEFQPSSLVGLPQVVGSRVVYLEKDGSRSAAGHCRTRLKIIDFAPYSDLPSPSPKAWSLLGKYSILRPGEYQRDFSATTTNGLVVENIFATEDNIVLLLVGIHTLIPNVILKNACHRRSTVTLDRWISWLLDPHLPKLCVKKSNITQRPNLGILLYLGLWLWFWIEHFWMRDQIQLLLLSSFLIGFQPLSRPTRVVICAVPAGQLHLP